MHYSLSSYLKSNVSKSKSKKKMYLKMIQMWHLKQITMAFYVDRVEKWMLSPTNYRRYVML